MKDQAYVSESHVIAEYDLRTLQLQTLAEPCKSLRWDKMGLGPRPANQKNDI